ncbi:NAD-dependent epimerase/dehydratase family protein [Lacinutrix salivirga]
MSKKIILLTGGTGFLGKEIIKYLISEDYYVRVLTRNTSKLKNSERVTYVKGDLLDTKALKMHLSGCFGVIHAAGEKKDVSLMEAINVKGSINICNVANQSTISYFCYVSSVGVVGLTPKNIITEETDCNPINFYEKTKFEGELYFLKNFNLKACTSVILRPTNVFGKNHLNFKNSFFGKIKRAIKGNEIANYIYVKDVAYACVYFLNKKNITKQVYNLNDDLKNNTFKKIEAIATGKKVATINAPVFLPYLLRFLKFGKNNIGNKYYSNTKLINTGFVFPYGLKKGIKDALS